MADAGKGRPRLRALVVEDDKRSREGLVDVIELEGFEASGAATIAGARVELESFRPELVLVDLHLPDGSGLDLLETVFDGSRADPPDVIVVTGHSSVETAVNALRLGAIDYLVKPLDVARLHAVLQQASGRHRYRSEIRQLRDELRGLGRFGPMIGSSKPMQELYDQIARVAPTEASVLILGESGTGKELVAETVHELSRRRAKAMISINCGAISPNLIESELFGHERGSFTGADRTHRGHFERADGSTLFLDEVSEMPAEVQVKLLRVLESGTIVRVGGDSAIRVNVRIIAAAKPDLALAVSAGRFRSDLYYRLNVFPISLPPLRARGGDLTLLVEHFLSGLNRASDSQKLLTLPALEALRRHDWPGNVRELKHVVERAFILSDRVIGPRALTGLTSRPSPGSGPVAASPARLRPEPGMSLQEAERLLILSTLDQLEGNKSKAAEVLQISTKTLYSRLREYRAARPRSGAADSDLADSEPAIRARVSS